MHLNISPFLLKSSFVIFFLSLTMVRSRSRSRSRSPVPPPARQIVATQQMVATFYADGTSRVSAGRKKKVCKEWPGFSGYAPLDLRRTRAPCYARGSKWAEDMCWFHARLNGCQPPQKKPKTGLEDKIGDDDKIGLDDKIGDDDKIGLEGVVVEDDE